MKLTDCQFWVTGTEAEACVPANISFATRSVSQKIRDWNQAKVRSNFLLPGHNITFKESGQKFHPELRGASSDR